MLFCHQARRYSVLHLFWVDFYWQSLNIAYFYELSLRKLLGVSLIGIKKETGSQCSISVLEVSQC